METLKVIAVIVVSLGIASHFTGEKQKDPKARDQQMAAFVAIFLFCVALGIGLLYPGWLTGGNDRATTSAPPASQPDCYDTPRGYVCE